MAGQGLILKQLCKQFGISAADLAEFTGYEREYIYQLFKKRFISSEVISNFCKAHGVSPGIFFDPVKDEGVTLLIIKGRFVPRIIEERIIFSRFISAS